MVTRRMCSSSKSGKRTSSAGVAHMKEECRIGLVQVETHANKKETLAACAEQMLQLAAQGADIICLPEFLNIPGDPSFDNTIDRYAWAETLDGPTVSMARTSPRTRGSQ